MRNDKLWKSNVDEQSWGRRSDHAPGLHYENETQEITSPWTAGNVEWNKPKKGKNNWQRKTNKFKESGATINGSYHFFLQFSPWGWFIMLFIVSLNLKSESSFSLNFHVNSWPPPPLISCDKQWDTGCFVACLVSISATLRCIAPLTVCSLVQSHSSYLFIKHQMIPDWLWLCLSHSSSRVDRQTVCHWIFSSGHDNVIKLGNFLLLC